MSVGTSPRRRDGVDKVTGAAKYVDDLRPDGCLYGATVRSPHARARIRSITRDPDYDWTGVTLVTAKDIPGKNLVFLMTEDQPALASDQVRHAHEAVALVAAPTRDKALEAAKHVVVDYKTSRALTDYTRAQGAGVRIYGADNVFKEITIEKGDLRSVATGTLVEGSYTVGHQEQLYIEPQGILVVPNADGSLTIIGSLQCPYYIVKALAGLLDGQKINVVQACTGGGFGGKEEYPSMIAAHAALLAIHTGRPVKLIYRRDEDLRATTKRHPATIRIRTRVDDDGTLLSWESDVVMDGGAYNTLSPVVLSRAVIHGMGPYRADHVRIHGTVVATNSPPNGAFRGFGAPQAMFAVERHMDRIARRLCLDPVLLRRRNLLREGDTTATGQVMTQVGGLQVLDVALEAAPAPSPFLVSRPGAGDPCALAQLGRGVAVVFHGCGFTGNGEARLEGRVALELRGQRIHVLSGSTDIGQGTRTILPQIVAEELGIDAESVVVEEPDTAAVPDSGPTVASRTAMVVGGVTQKAAVALKAALEAEIGTDGSFSDLLALRESEQVLRAESVYEDDGSMTWDDVRYQGDAYPTYGWSACVVDLAVNMDTGEVSYRHFTSATDVGRALNPVLCTGQIEGGSLQGLGYATCEEVVLDDQAGQKNDRLTNYIIPTSLDAPEMTTVLIELPYAGGPFGAKGVGEIPMDGPAAAVAQAIEDASGAVLDRLPMTPERVLEALCS